MVVPVTEGRSGRVQLDCAGYTEDGGISLGVALLGEWLACVPDQV